MKYEDPDVTAFFAPAEKRLRTNQQIAHLAMRFLRDSPELTCEEAASLFVYACDLSECSCGKSSCPLLGAAMFLALGLPRTTDEEEARRNVEAWAKARILAVVKTADFQVRVDPNDPSVAHIDFFERGGRQHGKGSA